MKKLKKILLTPQEENLNVSMVASLRMNPSISWYVPRTWRSRRHPLSSFAAKSQPLPSRAYTMKCAWIATVRSGAYTPRISHPSALTSVCASHPKISTLCTVRISEVTSIEIKCQVGFLSLYHLDDSLYDHSPFSDRIFCLHGC